MDSKNNKESADISNNIWEKIVSHKRIAIASVSAIALIILIILIINIKPNSNIDNTVDTTPNVTNTPEIIPDFIETIENIVNSHNDTEVETISNRNNEQAEIIFDKMQIDIKDLYGYSANIDLREDSAHIIMIIRPKEENYDTIVNKLAIYCADKQSYFIQNNKEDSELCNIAENSIICEINGYVIVVMEKDAPDILQGIINELVPEYEEAIKVGESDLVTEGTEGTDLDDEGPLDDTQTNEIVNIFDGLVTYYELSDGTWATDENNYKYKLEITGRLNNAAKDSTYVYLSNIEDITFEQASKASGLSSNTEDYFDVETAVLVEMS